MLFCLYGSLSCNRTLPALCRSVVTDDERLCPLDGRRDGWQYHDMNTMKVCQGLPEPGAFREPVVTVGMFDGVHLGQDDVKVSTAREIVPENFIIGKSTHSLEQALAAEADGADYIGIGPVYATPTKVDYIPIGVETVKQVMEKVKIPFVCIGGLNLDNYGELIDLGAKNVAMVREFQSDTAGTVKRINDMIRF